MGKTLGLIQLMWFVILPACGHKKSGGGSDAALPHGLYDVAPAVCLSTMQPPKYPAANYKATLLGFDGLIVHTLNVGTITAVETVQDSDCTLEITRTVYQNHSGEFALRQDRKHVWSPAGCLLQITHNDVPYEVGQNYSDLFKDSDEKGAEIPYAVSNAYQLTSRDDTELNDLWASYGCSKPDRLQWSLAARAN